MGSRWILAVAGAAALLAAPGAASGATFVVGSGLDDNAGAGACATAADGCTLRTAVIQANAAPGPDAIALPAGPIVLTRSGADEDAASTGDLDVAGSLAITGAGAGATTLDGGALDRIFDVLDPAAELSLAGLTISNGNVTGGAGGIRSIGPAVRLSGVVLSGITGASAIDVGSAGAGTLSLADSTITATLTTAALLDLHPAGSATLSLTHSTIQGTTVTAAAGTPSVIAVEPGGGQASVVIDRGTFASNVLGGVAGAEGLLNVAPTGPGAGTPTTVSIADSSFSHNALGADGAGAVRVAPAAGGSTVVVARSRFDQNTAGAAGAGRGGALSLQSAGGGAHVLAVTDSLFTANVAGAAGAGQGGAIDFSGGPGSSLTITGSTFAANRAGPAGGTQGARGGAVSVGPGTTLTVTNSTFTDNAAAAPAPGDGGGALWLAGAGATLTNVTIAANAAGPQGTGAGIDRAAGAGGVTVRNSILAGNALAGGASDCGGGPVTGAGHNLEGAGTCGFGGAGDFQGTDPLLAPLADNGGPTPTRMPDPASRAVDAGDPATCAATDQRGVARPQGAACDIGAVEIGAPAVVVATTPVKPVIKAAPEPRPRLRATDVIGLPSAKKCVSHRRFTVRIHRPKGTSLSVVRVFINGARVRLLKGRRITTKITLKRVPQGRFELRVTVLTGSGAAVSLSRTQRYRTCARRLRRA